MPCYQSPAAEADLQVREHISCFQATAAECIGETYSGRYGSSSKAGPKGSLLLNPPKALYWSFYIPVAVCESLASVTGKLSPAEQP